MTHIRTYVHMYSECMYVCTSAYASCVVLSSLVYRQFGFTLFSMTLNEPDHHVKCPTDSRWRPDQRLLEDGNVSADVVINLSFGVMMATRKSLSALPV